MPREKIVSPGRKKKLMKKLAQIRFNRSRGNNSFIDFTSFYETKVRKLKSNNSSLARALADQRQISKTWYDEVVSIKEELHHSQESLLRCRVREHDDYDHIIQGAVERQIRTIAGPLESSVQDALDNVCGLVDNLTKVKQILSSVLAVSKEQFNCSRTSQGSNSTRPLSRTPKSPRKNIVHPMVDGHVLQPATIHLPRMSLEDRRRYRLRERADIREDTGMSAITEQSSVVEEETSVVEEEPVGSDSESEIEADAEVSEIQLDDVLGEEANNSDALISSLSNSPILNSEEVVTSPDALDITPNNESDGITTPIAEAPNEVMSLDEIPQDSPKKLSSSSTKVRPSCESNPESSPRIKENTPRKILEIEPEITSKRMRNSSCEESSLQSKTEVEIEDKLFDQASEVVSKQITKGKHKLDSEDPLEGSSWMHTKRKRNSKKKRSNRNSSKNNIRTSGMHFLLNSSDSESEETVEKCKPIPLRVKEVKTKNTKQDGVDSPKSDIATLSHLDLLGSIVSRRSKKQSRGSTISSKRSPKGNVKEYSDVIQAVPLESFIINDESTVEINKRNLNANVISELELTLRTGQNETSSVPKTPTVLTDDEIPNNNATCLLSTPMDMTECLTKDLLRDIRANIKSPTVPLVNCLNVLEIHKGMVRSPNLDDSKLTQLPLISNEALCSDKEEKISKLESNLLNNKHIKRKSNKFFKCCNDDISKEVKATEKTPFDLSLIDASVIDSCYYKLGKENVPPNRDDKLDHAHLNDMHKLKDISIVVEDIMKTPAIGSSPDTIVKSCSNKVSNSVLNCGGNKSTNDKRKRKSTKKGESPARKVAKKRKKIIFPERKLSSPLSDDDDDWSPTKKYIKKNRKTKTNVKKKSKPPSPVVKDLSHHPTHINKEIDFKNDNNVDSGTTVDPELETDITKSKSSTKIDFIHSETNLNLEYVSQDYMLEKNENSSRVSNDVIANVNNMIKMNIENGADGHNPLAIHIDVDQENENDDDDDDDDDDDIQVIEIKCAVDPIQTESTVRPRRAAARVTSFKEPSLNVKLRRNSLPKNPRKKTVKKLQEVKV